MQEKFTRAEWHLIGAAVCATGLAVLGPHLALYSDYHAFADHREALGVPSALNVLSNLPFAVGGFWGLLQVARNSAAQMLDTRWWLAALFFSGLVATAVGSSVYHWAPSDFGLTLDRMGMVVAFAGLAAMAVADRVSVRSGLWAAGWVTLAGLLSSWWWLHAGNLLPWAVVQGGGLLLIGSLALSRPAHGALGLPLAQVAGVYLLAKVLEIADQSVFELTLGLVSGHTLKHLVAATVVLPLLTALPKPEASPRRAPSQLPHTSV